MIECRLQIAIKTSNLETTVLYILVINVTAACIRGCAASVGLLVTGKEKKGKGGEQRGQQTVKVPS